MNDFSPLLILITAAVWCAITYAIESWQDRAADRDAARTAALRKAHKRHLVSALLDAGSIRKDVR